MLVAASPISWRFEKPLRLREKRLAPVVMWPVARVGASDHAGGLSRRRDVTLSPPAAWFVESLRAYVGEMPARAIVADLGA